MRNRLEIARQIEEGGVVAIVRLSQSGQLVRAAEAIAEGGLSAIEFTMTTPGALNILQECAARMGDRILLGAGTVMDAATARAAILAGAEFLVSPALCRDVVETAHRYGKVCLPGAFTPTEIMAAMEMGADFVKLFPASVGGPAYLKAVRAPLPQARIVPTGGVNLDTAGEFLRAGAAALAVGGEMVNQARVESGDFAAIAETAKRFREEVEKARGKRA